MRSDIITIVTTKLIVNGTNGTEPKLENSLKLGCEPSAQVYQNRLSGFPIVPLWKLLFNSMIETEFVQVEFTWHILASVH